MSETTTLHDGCDVPTVALKAAMMDLRKLQETSPIAFYELVTAARDPQYAMFGNSAHDAKAFSLVQQVYDDGTVRIHDITRAVICNAVTGEDFAMSLRNPAAESSEV